MGAKEQNSAGKEKTVSNYLKFIIPSLVGIFIFLTPVHYAGKNTIVMGIILDWVRAPLEQYNLAIILFFVTISALGSLYFLIKKPDWKITHPILYSCCHVSPVWFGLRVLGAVFGWMIYLQMGPDLVLAENTGIMAFTVIGTAIVFTGFIGCMLMPFLTDFGLLEFIGVMTRKPFKLLFNLPGRAVIDATTSILSNSMVGVLITIKQYEDGHYTAREAAAIATNFSIISLPFSLVIAETAGLEHVYYMWYLTVIGACILCAFIMVRIPPLSTIEEQYYGSFINTEPDEKKPQTSLIREGLNEAVHQASIAQKPLQIMKNSWGVALSTIANVTGPAMAIVTISTILIFHTPIFEFLSWPIFQILDFFNFPEAKKAAPGFIVGYFDQFTPALVASSIENEKVRFILAGFSVAQLIYMSDLGMIILRSSLPLDLKKITIIFILRTLILFPIFLIVGNIIL